LQQLPDYLPAPLVEEAFQLEGREPGRGGAGELGGQRGEHGFRERERIIRGTAQYAAMRVVLPSVRMG
jgi:hypothetical protein